MRRVLVIGATGLVGSECVELLIDDRTCSAVTVVARSARPAMLTASKVEWHQIDFDAMSANPGFFVVDQIICAMGTTRSQTPSEDVYRKIDLEYPLTAARLGLDGGATHYLVVTALSANANSRVFYNRLKGELENSLERLDYRSLTIVRPSILVGERASPRFSEQLAWKAGSVMPKKYRPVRGAAVARALVDAARVNAPGVRVITNREILERYSGSGS